ncbi:MAG: MFS transporter [Thermoproteus sp.]
MAWIKRNVAILYGVGYSKGFINGFLTWYLSLKLYDWGLAVFAVVRLAAQVLDSAANLAGGYLADRIGRKPTLIITDVVYISSILCLLKPELLPLAVLLFYTADGLPTSASFVMRIESVPENWRGKIISIGPALSYASYAAGSFALGLIAASHGHTWAIYVILAISAAGLAARFLLIETARRASTSTSLSYLRELKTVFTSRIYGRVLAVMTLLGISFAISPFIAPFLKEVVGMSEREIAMFFTLYNLVPIPISLALGHLVDKYRELIPRLMAALLLADFPFIALFALFSPAAPIFAYAMLGSVSLASIYRAALNIYVSDVFKTHRGLLVALNAILMANLPGVAIPLVAALWAVLGPTLAILLVAAVRLAAAAVLLASYGKRSTGPPT